MLEEKATVHNWVLIFLSFLDIETDASLIMIPKWNLDMTKGQGTDKICSL